MITQHRIGALPPHIRYVFLCISILPKANYEFYHLHFCTAGKKSKFNSVVEKKYIDSHSEVEGLQCTKVEKFNEFGWLGRSRETTKKYANEMTSTTMQNDNVMVINCSIGCVMVNEKNARKHATYFGLLAVHFYLHYMLIRFCEQRPLT